jgi:F0F1-type ATP synthase assembly protein I
MLSCDTVDTICHSIKREQGGAECARRGNSEQKLMKALLLYALFVVIGISISVGIGYFVEREVSSTASLIVFLFLFFSNFAVSWIAVILAMDGSLKDAQGHQAQLDIEKSGRAGIALREANAVAGRAAIRS